MLVPAAIWLASAILSSGNAAGSQKTGCSATDVAPFNIAVLSAPEAGSALIRRLSRSMVATTLVRMDMASVSGSDWIQVHSAAPQDLQGWVKASEITCRISSQEANEVIQQQAEAVIHALKAQDLSALADSVHPVRGLRFSPDATVDLKSDAVLTRSQLRSALQKPVKRTWGADDGTGEPIVLTFGAYYRRFVYDRDFAKSRSVTYNTPPQRDQAGNLQEIYPNDIVVQYLLPETSNHPAERLQLVFQQHQGHWYLCGIVHAGWTI